MSSSRSRKKSTAIGETATVDRKKNYFGGRQEYKWKRALCQLRHLGKQLHPIAFVASYGPSMFYFSSYL